MGKTIYVIPDTQAKPNVLNPLEPVAYHIAEVKPQYIIHLGDHWDMPSLSQYDKGKKSHRVKTYLADINAGNQAMQAFFSILDRAWPEHHNVCKKIILEGNHEHRIHRAYEYGPDELVDLMKLKQRDYTGWDEMIPFLQIKEVEGVNFSHYFQNDGKASPISKPNLLLQKRHVSCVAGHKQGFEYAEQLQGSSGRIQAIIAGSCYYHDEAYKTHTNHHWRGTLILRDVSQGMFDFSRHSLASLDARYYPNVK